MLRRFSCVRLFATLLAVVRQAPLSMGISRQEYWSGLPCPPPRCLPNSGMEPVCLMSAALAGRSVTASATWDTNAEGADSISGSGRSSGGGQGYPLQHSCLGNPMDRGAWRTTAHGLAKELDTTWRRKWQPTTVLLPGKSHGWRSLVGYSPWGRKESDTTERLHFHFSY